MSMDYSRVHSFYNPDTQTFNSLPVISYTINNGETLKSHKFILQCGSNTLTIPNLANESILVDGTTTVTFDANSQVTNTDPVVDIISFISPLLMVITQSSNLKNKVGPLKIQVYIV